MPATAKFKVFPKKSNKNQKKTVFLKKRPKNPLAWTFFFKKRVFFTYLVSAERSWWAELKNSENIFFEMGKNRVSSAQFFWKVCQWNSIFIVDFFWLKGFLGRDREFFSNFNPQFFFAGAYPYQCQFVMIFSYNFTLEVFFYLLH